MQDNIQQQVLRALLVAMRPIARALLRVGIGYREFSEISKTAFVDIASKDYGLRGRPTNISRVAVMTGLTRKEVKRLRIKSDKGQETEVLRSTPMAVILHRWYTDGEFLDETGGPVDLEFESEGTSFSSLVRKHGGDIPPGAMRTELKRIRAIEEISPGVLRPLKRNVSDLSSHESMLVSLTRNLYPASLCMANNSGLEGSENRWIQRCVSTGYVRDRDLSRVRRISTERLAEFSESIDDLFGAYETLYDKTDPEKSSKTVGIGLYYFEEEKNDTSEFIENA